MLQKDEAMNEQAGAGLTIDTGRVFDLHCPPLTMGVGARRQLPEILRDFGERVFIVADPGITKQPIFQETHQQLLASGFQTQVFSELTPDPPIEDVLACAKIARTFEPAVFLGVGGGSTLDITKVAAILVDDSPAVEEMFGINLVPHPGTPTVLVPTTAGTGSEVTPIAVLSDETNQLKKGLVSPYLLANRALVDPEFCLTLPAAPTAYTGMDTLTHAIEAYTNRFAVPLIDALAIEAVRLVATFLERAVHDGNDLNARYAMSRASVLGGLCLGPVNTAAVHALAYPLGGRFHVPHGVANSLLMPHVLRFNYPTVEKRFEELATAVETNDLVTFVETLSAKVGTDRSLREFNVQASDLPSMARDAMQVTRLLKNNPRTFSEADALAIYEAAF